MQRKLSVLLSLILLFGLGFAASRETKAQSQENGVVDLSVKSCADFSAAESHLDAAVLYTTRNSEIADPRVALARLTTPNKVQQFMAWYASGGQQDLLITGAMCRAEMLAKSGDTQALRAGLYIAEQRARNAEFFANNLLKQYTGKSLY